MAADAERFDVFVSYVSDERKDVRALVDALRDRKLRVFLDERSIGHHEEISESLRTAIRNSTSFLAYYSRLYATRRPCQQELIDAFLLAQAAGQLRGRILVVNPEQDVGHIEPVELRDLRFHQRPTTPAALRRLADDVAAHVRELPGPLSAPDEPVFPRWWPAWPLPDHGVIHRYRELWLLHSALHAGEFPYIDGAPALGLAVLSGLPGTGKTTLAEQYALAFGAAFPGGIYRFGLDPDQDPASALLEYRRMMREMAAGDGIPVEGVSDDRLPAAVADHFAQRGQHVLWIVDQVPGGMPADAVRDVPVPTPYVRTILTTRENRQDGLGVSIPLAGLTEAEGMALLAGGYEPGEEAEAAALIREMGGHPQDLRMAGARLQESRGLTTVSAYRARITGAGAASGPTAVMAEVIGRVDEFGLSVLGVAAALAPAVAIPRQLLLASLAALRGEPRERLLDPLVEALRSLRERCVITSHETAVAVHPRVLRALPPGASAGCLRAAGAAVAVALAEGGDSQELQAHARHLISLNDPSGGLPDDVAIPILQWLIRADELTQNHLSAGRSAERLARRLLRTYGPHDTRTRQAAAAAAAALVAGADYRAAVPLTGLALSHEPGGDEVDVSARHARAAALDGFGQFDEAEPYWQVVEGGLAGRTGREADAVRLDRVRALRLRGRVQDAEQLLEQVTGADLPRRHVEEAALHLLNGRARQAREAARRALDAFGEANQSRHQTALEAAGILVDAELTVRAFNLLPFNRSHQRRLREMGQLCEDYRSAFGPRHPLTLTARVEHGIHQARWGSRSEARVVLEAVEPDVRAVLGERHTSWLRTLYGLSLVHAQRCDYEAAMDAAGRAYAGQRVILGDSHRDTLYSMLHLGFMRHLVHGDAEAARLISESRRELARVLGLGNDQVWLAYLSEGARFIPPTVLRAMNEAVTVMEDIPGQAWQKLKQLFGRE